MKRLLIFACQYLPMIGGMERQIEFIASEFGQKGWSVDILTPRRIFTAPRREQQDNVQVIRFFSLPVRKLQGLSELVGMLCFLLFGGFRQYHVVHCHNLSRLALILLCKAVKREKCAILTLHSHPQIPQKDGKTYRRLLALKDDLKVIAVSEEVCQTFRRAFPGWKNLSLVDNGINLTHFSITTEQERTAWRKELNISEDSIVAAYVGRLSGEKGIDMLLRAVARVMENPEVYVLIAGGGPLTAEVAAFAEQYERVKYLGVLKDVTSVYRAADLYLLPSYREGMPVALIEAMATGLGSVVTATKGSSAVIDSGVNGVIVPIGDDKAFADAICIAADNRSLLKEWGRNSAEKSRSNWSGEKEIAALEALYEHGIE